MEVALLASWQTLDWQVGNVAKVLTFTCQHDNCTKTGTDRTEFKKVEYRDVIQFAYVLCNEHAARLARTNQGETND